MDAARTKTDTATAALRAGATGETTAPGGFARLARRIGPPLAITLMLCTIASGLLLFGSGAHGGALSNVHVVSAIAFTVSLIGHLTDRRRQLAGLMRRRSPRALRSLLASLALTGIFVTSMVSGFAAMASGGSRLHVVVSLVLFVAYSVHGCRRIARQPSPALDAPAPANRL